MKVKMKDVPEAEREKILTIMEKNPDLFKKINNEVKKRMKAEEEKE